MYFIEQGDRSLQTIIFIHNGNGSSEIWEKQFEFFKDYHLIAIDLPGHGKSHPYEGQVDLDSFTKRIELFILKNNIESPIIIGNCIGSSIALNYSQLPNAEVKKLILLNTCPGKLLVENKIARNIMFNLFSIGITRLIFFNLLKYLSPRKMQEETPLEFLFNKSDSTHSSLYKSLKRSYIRQEQKKTRLNLLFNLASFDLENYYNFSNKIETYIIWAKDNKVIPISARRFINRSISAKEIIEIENAGHLAMYENHQDVNRYISAILND
jgi:pimeloyl-ACP methyl ester carboxylesterase